MQREGQDELNRRELPPAEGWLEQGGATEKLIDGMDGRALDWAIWAHVFQKDPLKERQHIPFFSRNLEAAFSVAQRMAERLFFRVRGDPGHLDDDELNSLTLAQCSARETDGAWFAAFQVFNPWPEDFEPENIKGLRAVALGRTAPIAICRAALKAVMLVKP